MQESRDRLLAQVNNRVFLFEITRDGERVLDPHALDETAALLAAVRHSEDDLEVRAAVGRLHWHRHGLLGDDRERAIAATMLRPVHRVDPDIVPPEIARTFPSPPRIRNSRLTVGDLVDRHDELTKEYERTGDWGVLDEALRVARRINRPVPMDHPGRGPLLLPLVATLQLRAIRTGDLGILATAIHLGRRSLEMTPDGTDIRLPVLVIHADNLTTWSESLGEPAIADHAVTLQRQAVELAGSPSFAGRSESDLADALAALGGSLTALAELTGAPSVLEEAVRTGRRAHELAPDDPIKMTDLAHALHRWYGRTADPGMLEEACRLDRQALELTPDEHPQRGHRLANLAHVLRDRARHSGRREDIDEAIALLRTAADDAASGAQQSKRLGSLATALRLRFDLARDPADLREAINLVEQALTTTPDGHPERPGLLTRLRDLLVKRDQDLGEPADPDRVIRLDQEALAAFPEGHPQRPVYLFSLGDGYRFRYQRTGDPADLDRAVDLCTQAAELIPETDPNRAACLFSRAAALRARFDKTGDLAALDEAIETLRQAAALWDADPIEGPIALAVLGAALRARFDRTGDPGDLRSAIDAGRRAARDAPRDARVLNNLENALQAWHEVTGDPTALREAVTAGRRAVDAVPDDHPNRGLYLVNLGNTLRIWGQGEGGDTALDEAIRAGRQAVEATPDDNPLLGGARFNLAAALRLRHERTKDADAFREAMAEFMAVAEMETAPPVIRVSAAGAWGELAADVEDWEGAYEGLARAVELLPSVAPRELDRPSQEYGLRDFPGLASSAAACALRLGRPRRAVELLEQGRGLLYSQALEARTGDVDELRVRDTALADRFERLRNRLNLSVAGDSPAERSGAGTARRRRELVSEWNALLARIRTLPGLEYFGRPAPVDRLLPEAGDGPIVMVNVSRLGSDALIITPDDVRSLPLPALTPPWVVDRVRRFHTAVNRLGPDATVAEQASAGRAMLPVLADLWDVVAGPVLEELGLIEAHVGDRPWPRVWWVPTGPLGLLPLHAAGHHDPDETRRPAPRTVLDRAVSSYLPTIHALVRARSRAGVTRATAPDALVVALSQAPGTPPLPGATDEADLLETRFDDARVLREHDATRDRVLGAIPKHRIAHFACHATADIDNPSQSHLHLQDGPLSVAGISDQDLAEAQLAYLSACATTRTDPALADEAIHMTSAFQLAGYAHVIGTLWRIADDIAPRLADLFYTELIDRRAPPAIALHEAVRKVRHSYPVTPALWASHIHTGP